MSQTIQLLAILIVGVALSKLSARIAGDSPSPPPVV